MQHSLGRGEAAVLARGVCAGTIESSSGKAKDAPTPRSMVRRERCLLVMNISLLYSVPSALPSFSYCKGGPFGTALSVGISTPSALLIWNGMLLTIPKTKLENR